MKKLFSLVTLITLVFTGTVFAESGTADFENPLVWGKSDGDSAAISHPKSLSFDFQEDKSSIVSVFEGTAISDWAKESVYKAYIAELVPKSLVGTDLTANVTREEFAAISVALYDKLNKGLSLATQIEDNFTDISDSIYKAEILRAYELGITTGTSETTFSPKSNITREQMATMLTRAYRKAKNPVQTDANSNSQEIPADMLFADDGAISSYARESVYFMVSHGIIQGIGDNTFAPNGSGGQGNNYGMATREQAIIIALRAVEKFR